MTRTRTRTLAAVSALALAGGATVAATGVASGDPATQSAPVSAPVAVASVGDDGLTHAAAVRAQRAALRSARGTAIDIDRDTSPVGYSVDVLSSSGGVTDVELDSRFRVTSRQADGTGEGLTRARAEQVKRAALRRVPGIATSVDTEDEGSTRFEVEVLRRDGREYGVALDRSLRVLSAQRTQDDD